MNERTSVIREIRKHSRQLVRELDVINGVYLGTGYTLSQCHVLFELSTHQSLNLMELARHLLMDKSNTSRTVKKLVEMGLVKAETVTTDNRRKNFTLTSKGKQALQATTSLANEQVEMAIDNLNTEQQAVVIMGLQLYAKALSQSRLQSNHTIRAIQKKDKLPVACLIREVMNEFQAIGPGYSIDDPEVDDMYGNYRDSRSCYHVVTLDEDVVGCGGIAPLSGGDKWTCELRKMFLLPAARGIGLGRRLLMHLLNEARQRGYRKCYLETLERMWHANELYRKNGFELLEKPIGRTGHCSCDRWYQLNL